MKGVTALQSSEAGARELLSVKRSLSDVNPACGPEREVHIPLVASTIDASTIWLMAETVSSSLDRAPVCDYFDRGISRELGPKPPIQPHVPAPHDEKAHPRPPSTLTSACDVRIRKPKTSGARSGPAPGIGGEPKTSRDQDREPGRPDGHGGLRSLRSTPTVLPSRTSRSFPSRASQPTPRRRSWSESLVPCPNLLSVVTPCSSRYCQIVPAASPISTSILQLSPSLPQPSRANTPVVCGARRTWLQW